MKKPTIKNLFILSVLLLPVSAFFAYHYDSSDEVFINDAGAHIQKQSQLTEHDLYAGQLFGVQCRIIDSLRQISIDCDWSTSTQPQDDILLKPINFKGYAITRSLVDSDDCIIISGNFHADISCADKTQNKTVIAK